MRGRVIQSHQHPPPPRLAHTPRKVEESIQWGPALSPAHVECERMLVTVCKPASQACISPGFRQQMLQPPIPMFY